MPEERDLKAKVKRTTTAAKSKRWIDARKPTHKVKKRPKSGNKISAQLHCDNRAQMKTHMPEERDFKTTVPVERRSRAARTRKAPIVYKAGYDPYIHISAKRIRIPCADIGPKSTTGALYTERAQNRTNPVTRQHEPTAGPEKLTN